jgi:centromeric protein E
MQETIRLLREQLNSVTQQSAEKAVSRLQHCSKEILENDSEKGIGIYSCEEAYVDVNTPTSVMSLNKIFSHEDSKEFSDNFSNTQVLMQAAEMENMKQEMVKVTEEKDGLEALSRKLAEEATYAKELASAAAVELRNLAEEVTRLSYENAKLTGDLAAVKEAFCRSSSQRFTKDLNEKIVNVAQPDGRLRKSEGGMLVEELQKELSARHQREVVLNAALSEKDQVEGNLRRRLDEAKQREQELENELTNMWMLGAKMRQSGINVENISSERIAEANKPKAEVKNGNFSVNGHAGNISSREHSTDKDGMRTHEELDANYQKERSRCKELECIISRFKGEDINDLKVSTLEEFQNLRFSC